jgi:hypothetical protein
MLPVESTLKDLKDISRRARALSVWPLQGRCQRRLRFESFSPHGPYLVPSKLLASLLAYSSQALYINMQANQADKDLLAWLLETA